MNTTKPILTAKEIRVLELATDVIEKVATAEIEEAFLSERAETALEAVRSVRDSFGKSKPLLEEP